MPLHPTFDRVVILPDVDPSCIPSDIVDPVGNGFAQQRIRKVMDIDRDRLEAPGAPSLLEVADQFAG